MMHARVPTTTTVSRKRSGATWVAACACGVVLGISASSHCAFVSSPSFARADAGRTSVLPRHAGGYKVDASEKAVQQKAFDLLRADLFNENIWNEGLIYTPLAADVDSVDPLFRIQGKMTYQTYLGAVVETTKRIIDENTMEFTVSDMKLVKGDFNPFADAKYPPLKNAPGPSRASSFAVYFKWEMSGKGRVNFAGLIEQKPLYMSGQDVFRFDSMGKVHRIDAARDQDPVSFGAYFLPLAHVTPLDSVLPFLKNALPAKRDMEQAGEATNDGLESAPAYESYGQAR